MNKTENQSLFQLRTCADIEQRDDFAYFVGLSASTNEPERKRGPFMVLWYDKSNNLHGWKLGLQRILNRTKSS